MPARRGKRRARSTSAPSTAPERQNAAPRPHGLAAGRWLLAAETLPTRQNSILIRASGEKEFLMRRPYHDYPSCAGLYTRASTSPVPNMGIQDKPVSDFSQRMMKIKPSLRRPRNCEGASTPFEMRTASNSPTMFGCSKDPSPSISLWPATHFLYRFIVRLFSNL